MANQDKNTTENTDYQKTWGSTPAFKNEMAEKLKTDDEYEGVLVDSIRAEGLEPPKPTKAANPSVTRPVGTSGA